MEVRIDWLILLVAVVSFVLCSGRAMAVRVRICVCALITVVVPLRGECVRVVHGSSTLPAASVVWWEVLC